MFSRPTSTRPLFTISRRYLLRHPWQSALMVIGIMLGVAVVVAIDLANASAARAFDLSTEAVAGRASHQIVGGPQGLDESVYTSLRRQGVATAGVALAPVLSEAVTSPQLGGRPLTLLGTDPFVEAPFRGYLATEQGASLANLTTFLSRPGAVLLSQEVADRYGPAVGDGLTLMVGGYERSVFLAGLVQPGDSLSRRALDGLLLADIATAQELTGRLGRLDRIDVILPADDPAAAGRLQALLPTGANLLAVAARAGAIREMTAAFRTNLTALSLLALVVGLFLIYNTMTFSVVQRRPLFGALRCLGVTRREVFALVLGEALLVGLIGSALGLAVGVLMGQAAVRAVTQTINDLYFVVTVRGVAAPLESLVKGALLGLAATLLTAAPPAWEAASTPPRLALSRSELEGKARRAVRWVALASLGMMAAGLALLAAPSRGLGAAFAGASAMVIGIGMQTPLVTGLAMRVAAPVAGWLWGALGRFGPRSVVNSLSRTAIAIAALMVAVSVSIGVGLMVGSFRHTVEVWLAETVQGDIYISPPGPTAAAASSAAIDPTAEQIVRGWPGLARVDALRSVAIDSPLGPIAVGAVDNPDVGDERQYQHRQLAAAAIWPAMQAGGVLVSEPLANRLGLPRRGAEITLFTAQGPRAFPVLGVYYDYASSQGVLLMALPLYRRLWQDDAINALALRLDPDAGLDPDQVTAALQDALAPVQSLVVRPNRALRDEALAVFDRTFAITGALQGLTTLVAFIGVLSALLSLILDKQRDLGILRAVGVTTRQMRGLIALETGLMGAVAGLLAMPTGFALSMILIYIINRRSFGWTLQLQLEPGPFVQALIVAVAASLLAGVYPAHRMSKLAAAEAIRYE